MTTIPRQEHPESEFTVPVTMMAPDIDWLHCKASLCRISLFDNDRLQSDKERKLVCFVDVSSYNERYQDQDANNLDGIEPPERFDLEEREIVVIKDDNRNFTNTEGAVCFFKQGHCEKGNVVSWLSSDLQKYAIGFQHALSSSNRPPKSVPFEAPDDRSPQNSSALFGCSGA